MAHFEAKTWEYLRKKSPQIDNKNNRKYEQMKKMLTSKLSEYASRTSSSDLAVFVNFDMLIMNIISIFPNSACVSSTSALKFEISIDAYWRENILTVYL